jgi:hypothetical protein
MKDGATISLPKFAEHLVFEAKKYVHLTILMVASLDVQRVWRISLNAKQQKQYL